MRSTVFLFASQAGAASLRDCSSRDTPRTRITAQHTHSERRCGAGVWGCGGRRVPCGRDSWRHKKRPPPALCREGLWIQPYDSSPSFVPAWRMPCAQSSKASPSWVRGWSSRLRQSMPSASSLRRWSLIHASL